MASADDADQKPLTENAYLRTRLEEAQDTLRAIREGEVDALVVYGPEGERIYTLKGADHSYRILVETISEGTVTLSPDGDILYANQQMATMLGGRLEQIIGSTIFSFIPPNELGDFRSLLAQAKKGAGRGEICLKKGDGFLIPTLLSCRSLRLEEAPEAVCLVAMDLTGLKETETALKESEQKLRLLTSQLLNAQESERKRIASELHDGLGHALLTIKLQLRLLEKQLAPEQLSLGEEMESIVEYMDRLINDVRRLYQALTPGDLEDLGLTLALSSMVDEFVELHETIGWSVLVDNIDDLYPQQAQTVIY
jgi:PAS domain S-box-containing protein